MLLRRYKNLALVQLRISAAAGMAYRSDFIVEGVMTILWAGLTLMPLLVLYNGRETVAGWDLSSSLIVMGYFMAVKAVLEGVISPSLIDLVEKIRSGAFDYVLLKPIDAQAMISASRYEPWKIIDVVGAIALIVYAFYRRGEVPSIPNVGLGLLLFLAGVLAMYAIWIVFAAASFWVVRLDNLTFLIGAIFDTARWPVQVFRGAWRFVFTFVFPIAVMTTFPAMALLGTLDAERALGTLAGSALLLLLARLVWRTAIRSYTSASS
jgi:ABC-2 type transport system permease protein